MSEWTQPSLHPKPSLNSQPAHRLTVPEMPSNVRFDIAGLLRPRNPPPLVRTDEAIEVPPPISGPVFPVTIDLVNQTSSGTTIPRSNTTVEFANRPGDLLDNPLREVESVVDQDGNTIYYKYDHITGMYTYYGTNRPKLRATPAQDNYSQWLNHGDYYLPPKWTSTPDVIGPGPGNVTIHTTPYIPNLVPALVSNPK